MRITVTDTIKIANVDVEPNQTVEDVKAILEIEFGIPLNRQKLFFQNKELTNEHRLDQVGVKEDSMLFIQLSLVPVGAPVAPGGKLNIKDMIKNVKTNIGSQPQAAFTPSVAAYRKQAQKLKKQILQHPEQYAQSLERNHDLAEAIYSDDIDNLAKLIQKKDEQARRLKMEKEKEFYELSKNPFSPEYQKLLEEHINRQNIQSNYEHATEFTPEVFGSVCMLYINATINKVPIQAFVDSGAQSTVMSVACAERCGVMRLVDKRFQGMAVGVGTSKIIGRVHAAQIGIEGKFITCSLTVVQSNGLEFLLGLDMLKRFNCLIDLKKGVLNFQDGMIITPFLHEGEIKKQQDKSRKGSTSSASIDEQKVKSLEQMGFGRQQAIDALNKTGGNQMAAANLLAQKRAGK